jgi:hypothetical protein
VFDARGGHACACRFLAASPTTEGWHHPAPPLRGPTGACAPGPPLALNPYMFPMLTMAWMVLMHSGPFGPHARPEGRAHT